MRRAAPVVFFVSGFAALVYQVVWQRLLTFFGGTDVISTTIVVASFMAGLGLGSIAGGHVADRVSVRGRLCWVAAAESGVALFALVSVWIFYDFLYWRLGPLGLSSAASAALLFALLLWPTLLMGMSLPLLARAVSEEVAAPARWVLTLYAWNTLGASCGSLCVPWVLLRHLDFRTTVACGALLNVLCAVVIGLYASRMRSKDLTLPERDAAEKQRALPHGFPMVAWIATYALSGFVALSLEIVWFRVLGVFIKSNSSTFGTLLAIYLAGVGVGALVADRTRLRSLPAVRAFLWVQAAIPVSAAILVAALVAVVEKINALDFLWRYVADYESIELGAKAIDARLFATLFGAVPMAVMSVPTVMMGMTFSYLQRAVQTEPNMVGRRVGWLQAANIAGATLGALATGLVGLHLMGSAGMLRLLAALGGPFLLMAWVSDGARRQRSWRYGLAAGTIATAILLVPGSDMFWSRLHAARPDRVIVGEDRTGLSLLKMGPPETTTLVFANGLGQSKLPYGGIHTALGALAILTHPAPRRVAVIGLGSGDTLFGIGGRSELTTIDSLEIIQPELDSLRRLDRVRDYPGLRRLLRDERIRHRFEDGRAFLLRQTADYDVIEADALRPDSASAGNLYSTEYFELLKSRLQPNGLAVTWCPTQRACDTFVSVFPYVVIVGEIAMGSAAPIPFDPVRLHAQAQEAFTGRHYREGGIDIDALVEYYASSPVLRFGPEFARDVLTDVNRDLFPKDEFRIPSRAPALTTP